MMFKLFLCLLIGISAVSSAPVAAAPVKTSDNSNPVSAKEHSSVNDAFAPVKKDVRAMIGNMENGVHDVAKTAVVATRKEFAPLNEEDRANVGSNIVSRAIHSIRNVQRSVLVRAIADSKPVGQNAKSALAGTNDAINLLQSKYLTPDGQDLAKNLFRMSAPKTG